jgi:hypothetical protein
MVKFVLVGPLKTMLEHQANFLLGHARRALSRLINTDQKDKLQEILENEAKALKILDIVIDFLEWSKKKELIENIEGLRTLLLNIQYGGSGY